MNKIVLSVLAGSALLGHAAASHAVTFGSFTDVGKSAWSYTGVNPTPSGTSSLATPGGDAIAYYFKDFLDGELPGHNVLLTTGAFNQHPYAAHLNVTNANATLGEVPKNSHQNAFDSITIIITGDNNPTNVAAGIAGKILLKVTAGTSTNPLNPKGLAGTLLATDGQAGATLSGGNPTGTTYANADFVKFSSDVFGVAGINSELYALSFSGLYSTAHPANGVTYSKDTPANPFSFRYLDSFKADGTGTFSAATPVPEPGMVTLLTGSLVSLGALSLRRRRK